MAHIPNSPFTVRAPAELAPGEPYCGACGYALVGSTESARCPECGGALVDVLRRKGDASAARGKRYRSDAMIFGVPVLAIAFGPDRANNERFGKPRGLIALGDQPIGGIAIGGMPVGVVALGGMSLGVCTLGGLSVGLLAAFGGMTIAPGMSVGGMSFGGLASGGGAIGYFARGGLAIGRYAWGGSAYGAHTITPSASDPIATRAFDGVSWFFGQSVASPLPMLATGGAILALGVIIALLALVRASSFTSRRDDPYTSRS